MESFIYTNPKINILLVFGSIILLILSVFIASQRFTERGLAMRNCYIRLDELYPKVKRAEKKEDHELIGQLESEYTSNLLNIENHSDYDYLCLRYALHNDKNTTLPPFTWIDRICFVLEKLWRALLIVLFFILPLIAIIVFNIINIPNGGI